MFNANQVIFKGFGKMFGTNGYVVNGYYETTLNVKPLTVNISVCFDELSSKFIGHAHIYNDQAFETTVHPISGDSAKTVMTQVWGIVNSLDPN